MQNPFESGHIKNYILLYVSVVVIMILFFIASSFFNDIEKFEKKVFEVEIKEEVKSDINATQKEKPTSRFKLLENAY